MSVAASAAVALAAVVASTVTASLDRRERRASARIDRQQPRLERAYLELAAYVHHRYWEARSIRPKYQTWHQPPPEALTLIEIERVRALVYTTASDEVRQLFRKFTDIVQSIVDADKRMTRMDEGQTLQGPDLLAQVEGYVEQQLETSQERLDDVVNQMHRQMRDELLELRGAASR